MECTVCEHSAKLRAAHGGVEMPFCSEACSEAFCDVVVHGVQHIGPKHRSKAGDEDGSSTLEEEDETKKARTGDRRRAPEEVAPEERIAKFARRANDAQAALDTIDPRLWSALPIDVRLSILGQTRLVSFYAALASSRALYALVNGDAARRLIVYRALIARVASVYGCAPSVLLLDRPDLQLRAILETRDVVITERSLPRGVEMLKGRTGRPLPADVAARKLISGVLPFKALSRGYQYTLALIVDERGDRDEDTARIRGLAGLRELMRSSVAEKWHLRIARSLRFIGPNLHAEGATVSMYKLINPSAFVSGNGDEFECADIPPLERDRSYPHLEFSFVNERRDRLFQKPPDKAFKDALLMLLKTPHALILGRRNAIIGPIYSAPDRARIHRDLRTVHVSTSALTEWSAIRVDGGDEQSALGRAGYYVGGVDLRVLEPPEGVRVFANVVDLATGVDLETGVDWRVTKLAAARAAHADALRSFSAATWTERVKRLELGGFGQPPANRKPLRVVLTLAVSAAVVTAAYGSVLYCGSVINDAPRIAAPTRIHRHDPSKPIDAQDGVTLGANAPSDPILLEVNPNAVYYEPIEAFEFPRGITRESFPAENQRVQVLYTVTPTDQGAGPILATVLMACGANDLIEIPFELRAPSLLGSDISDALIVERGKTAIAAQLSQP